MAGATGLRGAGVDGTSTNWEFPQREQAGAVAGFMLPQEAQRM
jgi:hypothetical protein